MRPSHVLLLALAFLVIFSAPGMAATDLKKCTTASVIVKMEGPCRGKACAEYCNAKFAGSGTCFPQGCKCAFSRDIPAATGN